MYLVVIGTAAPDGSEAAATEQAGEERAAQHAHIHGGVAFHPPDQPAVRMLPRQGHEAQGEGQAEEERANEDLECCSSMVRLRVCWWWLWSET